MTDKNKKRLIESLEKLARIYIDEKQQAGAYFMISEIAKGIEELEQEGKVDVYQMSDYFDKNASKTPHKQDEKKDKAA